jgi:hypothetical protein
MYVNLPVFAKGIPTRINLAPVEEIHVRLLLAMSRLGMVSDEDLAALMGTRPHARDVRELIEKGWQRTLDRIFDFRMLGVSATFIIPEAEYAHFQDEFGEQRVGVCFNGDLQQVIVVGRAFSAIESIAPGMGRAAMEIVHHALFHFGIPHTPSGFLEMCRMYFWSGCADEKEASEEFGEEDDLLRYDDFFHHIPAWALLEPECGENLSRERFRVLSEQNRHLPVGGILSALLALNALQGSGTIMPAFDLEECFPNEPPIMLIWEEDDDFSQIHDYHYECVLQSELPPWVGCELFFPTEAAISEAMPRILHTGAYLRALDAVLTEIEEFNHAQSCS